MTTLELEELHRAYVEASNAFGRAQLDALKATILVHFPSAIRFATDGTYEDIGGDLSLGVTKILDATDTVLWCDADDPFADLSGPLSWLGVLEPDEWEGQQEVDIEPPPPPTYKYVKIVAVARVRAEVDYEDVAGPLARAVDNLGTMQYLSLGDGYNGEFEALGADPTTWEPL